MVPRARAGVERRPSQVWYHTFVVANHSHLRQIGDQFDGGAATVQGLELSADFGLTGIADGRLNLPLSLKYTWTAEAKFESAFESDFEPWGDVAIGDELPYVPEHQLRATAGIAHEAFAAHLSANYVGRMRTVAGQGAFEPSQTIDDHLVWDLVGHWHFTEQLSTYIKVDNLFDETCAAARRPAGLRPGLERTAWVGLSFGL